ncbi:hypothetical protein LXL04_026995 [Taraxacum kok-saghyz]
MVREIMNDHKVICSSIAMLQERFRQLEKLKEMREERELLKLISFSSNNHQCNSYSLSSNFYEPNSKYIIFPTREPLDSQLLSLTLWPNSQITKKYADTFWDVNMETTQKLGSDCKPSWLTNVPLALPTLLKNVDESSSVNSDVDTTLHL